MTKEDLAQGGLLPDIEEIRKVTENVACALGMEARDSVLCIRLYDGELRIVKKISMWEPKDLSCRFES